MKVKKVSVIGLIVVLAFALMVGCGEQQTPQPGDNGDATVIPVELLVGAAMSLREVTVDLAEAYRVIHPHVTLTFTYASSGALQGQIEAGAPMDIFMSAAASHMQSLENQGLIYGTSRNVATNAVALVVPIDSVLGIESFTDVALDRVGIVGVADPAAVPIGRFAREVFSALDIVDQVYEKAVLANDARQVLTWVEAGEVDVGVVFLSDALSSDSVRIIETADSALHSPAVNPVGIVESSAHKANAQSFIDFLFSPTARAIFERHGFSI